MNVNPPAAPSTLGTEPHGGGEGDRPRNLRRGVFLPALLVLLGVAVMLYPVISTQWNNRSQERVAERYESMIVEQHDDPSWLLDKVAAARNYNETASKGPILDPWLMRISDDNVDYQAYLAQLSELPAMSQVVIPSVDIRLPVYHGTSDEVLNKGLGHLYGSSLPVGGSSTHSVITGHTGLPHASLFDNLIDVGVGDSIYVSTFGEKMKYRVYDTEVVLPDQTDSLSNKPGEDLLTLITCTPYGINTHRLLIHAERVALDPDEIDVFNEKTSFMQWWMWIVIILAIAMLAGIAWWARTQMQGTTRRARPKHLAV
ncbi:class C sortase [Corynebacterium mayonis]|uniref:class C sortase n=1 Tax=Corynebacterium mayonis TaxID=3062461 RepID=UPI0031406CEA